MVSDFGPYSSSFCGYFFIFIIFIRSIPSHPIPFNSIPGSSSSMYDFFFPAFDNRITYGVYDEEAQVTNSVVFIQRFRN